MKKLVLFLLTIFGIFVFSNCSKDSKEGDSSLNLTCTSTDTATYDFPVQAIMDAHCNSSSCHGSPANADGINLETYANVKAAASNDRFYSAIMHKSGADPMPQSAAKLHDTIIQKLVCWRVQGFREN